MSENEKLETLAAIVAQIRAAACIQNADTPESVLRLADRIEAAWKREKAKVEADALTVGGIVEAARTAEKSSAVGNAAAMREALVAIRNLVWEVQDMNGEGDVRTALPPKWVIDVVGAALSAPARNCDVGTAEEQTHRMLLYCKSHGVDESRCFRCKGCPLLTADICELSWEQMPYEAQEGDGK